MYEQCDIRMTTKTIKESMAMRQNMVKSFRLKLCWEQSRLAKEIGVSCGTVSCWEQGIREPSLSSIRKLESVANKHKIKFNLEEWTKGR